MDFVYFNIALITAGISLAMGSLSLFSGIHKDGDKTDAIFGLMCISLFIHFIISPVGFIVVDKAPYPTQILVKRIFNFLYAVLLPWFLFSFAGNRDKRIPLLTSALLSASYFIMAFTPEDSLKPLWLSVLFVPLALTIAYGFMAVHKLLKAGEVNKGRWLLIAMIIFTIFYLLTAINHFGNGYFSKQLGAKVFFPINLSPIAFILIMGIQLRANIVAKFKLQKMLGLRDKQWHSLLEEMQLIVLQLDCKGRVKYISPFGVHILGCKSADEILDTDWFTNFLPAHETSVAKALFIQAFSQGQKIPYYKNEIKTKANKLISIYWTNVFIYDDDGAISGLLSIGNDVTKEEEAYQEIVALKAALEKENLMLKGEEIPGVLNGEIVGQSLAISYAIQKARQVASSTATVLLEGETGVGKELFANLIHQISLRKDMPLIKVNCGALPAELIEDELFGHEKGAYTGAIQSRKGRFELANGGTIFLDEIGELPLSLQPKLLRVLQNGEFERVGGERTIKVDVRVLSATNKDLAVEVTNGRFREDLFYRLYVFPITIPPLRNRREDIPLLISYFIEKKSIKHNKTIKDISKADMNKLCNYSWPGNIRELKNVIERSIISATSGTLKLDWWGHQTDTNNNPHNDSIISLEQVERDHILKLLNDSNWRINGENGAAQKLAMHPSTLRSKLKKLNITRSKGN